jgi:hypothetical protein
VEKKTISSVQSPHTYQGWLRFLISEFFYDFSVFCFLFF